MYCLQQFQILRLNLLFFVLVVIISISEMNASLSVINTQTSQIRETCAILDYYYYIIQSEIIDWK